MADAPSLIDYYGVLNLPHRADLAGVENAYARLSHELATRSEVDETAQEALLKVNEAYSVLSKPEMRRAYDQEFFREELESAQRRLRAETRRQEIMSRALVGTLGIIVIVQASALVYLGGERALSVFTALANLFS